MAQKRRTKSVFQGTAWPPINGTAQSATGTLSAAAFDCIILWHFLVTQLSGDAILELNGLEGRNFNCTNLLMLNDCGLGFKNELELTYKRSLFPSFPGILPRTSHKWHRMRGGMRNKGTIGSDVIKRRNVIDGDLGPNEETGRKEYKRKGSSIDGKHKAAQ